MYRIMLLKSLKDKMYSFATRDSEGADTPIEFEDKTELKEYVEDMINNKGYTKKDFIIVSIMDFNISTDINTEE